MEHRQGGFSFPLGCSSLFWPSFENLAERAQKGRSLVFQLLEAVVHDLID
jgi:hypothetical protein